MANYAHLKHRVRVFLISIIETLIPFSIHNYYLSLFDKVGFMSRRKIWTLQEDSALKVLREQRGLRKWSEIAKKMGEQFGITQRTGKQCRERYHNHLDSAIVLSQWSREEEKVLYSLHEELGNKWSVISQRLPGRSDNCVKNHFYSKLRKCTRKLNRVIHESCCREWREIKMSLLNKIIQTTEERFKNSSKFEEDIIEKCIEIVNGLFRFEEMLREGTQGKENSIKELINDMMWIELRLRKSPKCAKEQRDLAETTHEARETQKIYKAVLSSERGDEPFYEMFRRVCESIMLNNN